MVDHIVRTELQLVRKHIRKYVIRNLDPRFGRLLPHSEQISRIIVLMLAQDIIVVRLGDDHEKHRDIPLVLDRRCAPHHSMDRGLHNDVLTEIEDTYKKEFHSTVDQMHLMMKIPMSKAIEGFRQRYCITEEDFPFESSVRSYKRHLREMGVRRRRGRTTLPLQLLRNPRNRDKGMDRPDLGA